MKAGITTGICKRNLGLFVICYCPWRRRISIAFWLHASFRVLHVSLCITASVNAKAHVMFLPIYVRAVEKSSAVYIYIGAIETGKLHHRQITIRTKYFSATLYSECLRLYTEVMHLWLEWHCMFHVKVATRRLGRSMFQNVTVIGNFNWEPWITVGGLFCREEIVAKC